MDIKIKLEIEDYEILNSGVIIIDQEKTLNFKFQSSDSEINFRFVFTEETEGEPRFETLVNETENYLEFKIINTNMEGQLLGNEGLAPLAKLEGKQIYLKFRVTTVGDEIKDKVFYYTWYQEK